MGGRCTKEQGQVCLTEAHPQLVVKTIRWRNEDHAVAREPALEAGLWREDEACALQAS
jgi:hypothetical protein